MIGIYIDFPPYMGLEDQLNSFYDQNSLTPNQIRIEFKNQAEVATLQTMITADIKSMCKMPDGFGISNVALFDQRQKKLSLKKKIKDYCDGQSKNKIKVELTNMIQLNIFAGKCKLWVPYMPNIQTLDDVLSHIDYERDLAGCNINLTSENWK